MGSGWYPQRAKTLATNKYYPEANASEVIAIVIHIADGYSADTWLAGPNTTASAHFVVKQGGPVTQLVSIRNRSFANGLGWDRQSKRWRSPRGVIIQPPWQYLVPGVDPNNYTISIEEEGYPQYARPIAQRNATIKLVTWIARELGWHNLVVGKNLIGHSYINSDTRKSCPGPHGDLEGLAGNVNVLLGAGAPPPPGHIRCIVIDGPANVRVTKSSAKLVAVRRQVAQGAIVDVIRTEAGETVTSGGITSNEWAAVSDGYIWFPLLKRLE